MRQQQRGNEPKVIVVAAAAKKAFSTQDLFLLGALALMSLFPLLSM